MAHGPLASQTNASRSSFFDVHGNLTNVSIYNHFDVIAAVVCLAVGIGMMLLGICIGMLLMIAVNKEVGLVVVVNVNPMSLAAAFLVVWTFIRVMR